MSKVEAKMKKKAKTAKTKGKAPERAKPSTGTEALEEESFKEPNLLDHIRALGGDEDDFAMLEPIESEDEEVGQNIVDVSSAQRVYPNQHLWFWLRAEEHR
jgi:hypothetical protein